MKYQEIIDFIDSQILAGVLQSGDKLPSIRAMSVRFSCNKDTVIRAYKELESSHRAYSIPKSGYYLVENLKRVAEKKAEVIDFITTLPDKRLLPYKEFNHSINKAIETYKQELFSYGDVQGLASLREVLETFFWDNQIYTRKDNIFITSGAQQAINILSNMPFPNEHKNVLIEQPTYRLMQRIAEEGNGEVLGIKRGYQGIDLVELESIFKTKKIKFFYTIPRFHNPLGTSYTSETKHKIVELAGKYNVYIIEDDYLGDLAVDKSNLVMHNYDSNNKVIYVKSFSKSFMPGIRIGAVVLPKELQATFVKYKRYDDLNTSVLSQGGLEIFLKSGMYSNHLKKMRKEYQKKMNLARACLKTNKVSGVEYFIPDTGFYIWVKLPARINANVLEKKLKQKKILIYSAKHFYIKKRNKENAFRLCISALANSQIKHGIFEVIKEIKNLSTR